MNKGFWTETWAVHVLLPLGAPVAAGESLWVGVLQPLGCYGWQRRKGGIFQEGTPYDPQTYNKQRNDQMSKLIKYTL